MIRSLIKFFKINTIIFRNAYIRDSKVPGFILANVLAQLLDIIISLVFFNVIFSNIKTLAGWNFYQVLFLYAYIKFIALIHQAWTRKGVITMAQDMVRLGEYDFFITKPFDSMVLVSISKPRLYSFITLFFNITLMIYAGSKAGIEIGISNFLWFILLTFFSVFLFYFLTVITVIPAFWITKLPTLTDLINRMIQFAKYPSGVFSRTLRVTLSTVFPIIVVSYFPVRTLFYPPEISYIVYMITITFVFGAFTRLLWRWGEKNYGSASS